MTKDEINALALKKARGSNALERQWTLTLARLCSSGLDDATIEMLAMASPGPAIMDRLTRHLGQDANAAARLLLAECDASAHGLPQWMEALDALYTWLEERSRTATLERALGYISCCCAAAPDADLKWTVGDMLRQFGMDRQ
ncbi:MAG: hypothetical protein WC360_01185 [Opitutales bacterium]